MEKHANKDLKISEDRTPDEVRRAIPQDYRVVTDGFMRDAEEIADYHAVPVFEHGEDGWLYVTCGHYRLWFLDVTIMRIGMDGRIYEYQKGALRGGGYAPTPLEGGAARPLKPPSIDNACDQ